MTNVNGKNLNRRGAFRVYEKANLFYLKIDSSQVNEPQENFKNILKGFTLLQTTDQFLPDSRISAIDQNLPVSQSQVNDTLNVNISSSGIRFTCKDELKSGDYLLIRVLLLSSMTVVMTCCKVVYCKPSNPYENDRYPFLIGAHFVNLTVEDTELLNRYISARKKQKLVVNGVVLASVMIILAMPGMAFGLLLKFFHYLLQTVLHLIHLVFMFFEDNLDHLIELTFHTDRHDTQIFVFYVLLTCGLAGLYFLWRFLPPTFVHFSNSQIAFWSRKKASFLYYWRERSLLDKIRIISIVTFAIICYATLLLSL